MHVLVLGTGSIGKRHLRNLQALVPGVTFTFLRRSAEPDDLAREVGATIETDLARAIAARPDFALVATPSALHADALVPLIQAGLPLYVEKPVVVDRAQLERVKAAAVGYRAPSLVGCNMRFLPSLARARAAIRNGELGTVVRANMQVGQWLPDWRPTQDYRQSYSADPALGGGVILDLIHEIDAARWLLGDFDRVAVLAGTLSGLEIRSEDTAGLLLGGDGPIATIGMDYVARSLIRRYEVVGTRATLVWDLPARQLDLVGPGRAVTALDAGADAFDTGQTYLTAMRELLAALATGAPTSQDLFDGLASTTLAIHAKELSST